MKKLFFVLLSTTVLLATVTACSSNKNTSSATPASTPSLPMATSSSVAATESVSASAANSAAKTFTTEELAKYNGKDGNPAYVAVDGIVYDVSNAPQWRDGEHKNGVVAGMDQTDAIMNKSPHGVSVLKELPVVGQLVTA